MWFSSCTLPWLSLHEVTARMWQIVFYSITGSTYCCMKLHYFGGFNNYKEEKRKNKLEFSFKSKARICSHLILNFSAYFFLSVFSISSNNLLYFTALLLIIVIFVSFLQELNFLLN